MTPDPETTEDHQGTQHDGERPTPRGEDPDSPGATIDDPEPVEPNEPG